MTRPFPMALPPFVAAVHLVRGSESLRPLHPAEAALLNPRARQTRRDGFTLGRNAAHLALEALGEAGEPILRGEHREPLWPEGIVGSITHTAGHAIAAVAHGDRCGGIGVDLEHADRWFPELADHIAFDEELAWLATLDDEAARRRTVELFSAKEAIYKAFFPRVRRFFGFEAARIRSRAGGGHTGRLVHELDPAFPPGHDFAVECSWYGDLVLTSVVLPPDRVASGDAGGPRHDVEPDGAAP